MIVVIQVNIKRLCVKIIELINNSRFVNNPSKWADCMYLLHSTDPEHGDLIVTGGHGILKQRLSRNEINADLYWFNRQQKYSVIDKMYLQRAAFSKDFVKITDNLEYTYYHLSLKSSRNTRYGIWANGVLSESTFKQDMLKQFKTKT